MTVSAQNFEDGGALVFADADSLSMAIAEQVQNFYESHEESNNSDLIKIFDDQLAKWRKLDSSLRKSSIRSLNPKYMASILSGIMTELRMVTVNSPAKTELDLARKATIKQFVEIADDNEYIFEVVFGRYESAAIVMKSLLMDDSFRLVSNGQLKEKIEQISSATDDLIERVKNSNDQLDQAGKKLVELQLETLPGISAAIQSLTTGLANLKEGASRDIEEASAEFRSRWSEFQSLVNSGIAREALKQPSKLWAEDAENHRKRSTNAAGVAFSLAVFCILLLPTVAEQAIDLSNRLLSDPKFAVAKLIFSGATTLIFLTFSLWATRIAVRQYMTEQHLMNDCRNRAAVTEAFIDLQKHMGGNFDASMLLGTLMRPAQDGMIKDDGLPPTMPAAALVSLLADLKKPTP